MINVSAAVSPVAAALAIEEMNKAKKLLSLSVSNTSLNTAFTPKWSRGGGAVREPMR